MHTRSFSFIENSYYALIKFFAHHKTYTAFLFVMLVAIFSFAFFSQPAVEIDTEVVGYRDIKQYVKVSGQVEASRDASLSFQSTGQVAYVGVKPGDKVSQNKILATLSAGDAQASLQQTEASLANARAVLGQLEQGARKEEVAVKEQALDNAKSSLTQAYSAIPDAIQNVDAVTADVVKNKFATLFMFTSGRYVLSFASCDQRLQSEIETKRTTLENTLADFQKKSTVITSLSSTQTIDTTFEQAYQAAFATNDLVNSISNLLLSSCSTANPSLDQARATLSSVKPTMTTLFSDITAKRSALITAKNVYNQASRDLDLVNAGTDPYRLKAQQAAVAQAEASVAQARANLAKTIIKAPFSGVISDVELSLGETVSTGKTVITMLATDGYEVEAKVPEVDIVKVRVGASVDITLDAYGQGIIFPATVTRINPAATTEGTVPVYTVIVTFSEKDERIRQGMTANVQIITENKSRVLAVSSRFVKVVDQTQGTVLVRTDGAEESRAVTLGARSSDGSIEISSGLSAGEILVPYKTTVREAQKQ